MNLQDKIMRKSKGLLLVFLMGTVSMLNAQATLQVVTKKIEKTLSFKNGYQVNIEGEKAEIIINTWDKDEVLLKMELISKHPDKKVAENDLKMMKYVADRIGKKIYLRNYLALGKNEAKPKSNLKAKYEITIPSSCPVNLNNYFGKAQIQDITKELKVNSEFCKLQLSNIEGKVEIKTHFGDIDADHINGRVQIISNRSNMVLRHLIGAFDIKAKYGLIQIDTDSKDVNLNIDAEKSDIQFLRPPIGFNFSLTAHHGRISVPDHMNFNFLERTEEIKRAVLKIEGSKSTINIKTSFGRIVLRPQA